MRFNEAWLANVITVPYVPTLGTFHPDEHAPTLFNAVLDTSGSGQFLPYDGGARWTSCQDEVILVEHVTHGPHLTVIPTLNERNGVLKVHHYGQGPPDFDAAAKLHAEYGTRSGRIIWFRDSPDQEGTRLLLKSFTDARRLPAQPVYELTSLPEPTGATFAAFADALVEEGFGFLHAQMKAGLLAGSTLVAVKDSRIVGAIGPMQLQADSANALRLLPQYLGVLPDQRGHGYGRALWRAACEWGHDNGAAYQLMQARIGGASEQMFLSEGLRTLGFIQHASL